MSILYLCTCPYGQNGMLYIFIVPFKNKFRIRITREFSGPDVAKPITEATLIDAVKSAEKIIRRSSWLSGPETEKLIKVSRTIYLGEDYA